MDLVAQTDSPQPPQARDGRVETSTLRFGQVKSIKHRKHGMRTGTKIVIGTLAGIGALVLVVVSIAATRGFG